LAGAAGPARSAGPARAAGAALGQVVEEMYAADSRGSAGIDCNSAAGAAATGHPGASVGSRLPGAADGLVARQGAVGELEGAAKEIDVDTAAQRGEAEAAAVGAGLGQVLHKVAVAGRYCCAAADKQSA